MSDVRGENFKQVVSAPSVTDEMLGSSIASDGREKFASSAQVGEEQATVTNTRIAELLGDLDDNVRAFTDRAEFYEDLVRKLQNRVESLQVDQVQQLLGPVLTRLAILITQSADAAQLARIHGEGYRADVEFEYFHDALIETLDLIGVESVGASPGAVCACVSQDCADRRAGAGLDGREGAPPRPRPCGCGARIPARAGERLPLRRGPRQLG